jgi:hypothetical protein
MFSSAGCSLLRVEGVNYGSLRISKLHFLIKKDVNIFLTVKLFNFFRQNPGSGIAGSVSAIRKNDGSGSALNQCGFKNPV